MSKPRRRTITIKLTAQQKSDAKAALDAVREALKPTNQVLRVIETPEEPEEKTAEDRRLALEQLETAVLRSASQLLEEKAQSLEQKRGGSERGNQAVSPEKVAEARKGLRDWIGSLIKIGWRITVQGALDWAAKKIGL